MADQQAGWYRDPSGNASKLRYWDGEKWTNDYTDALYSTQPPTQQTPSYQAQPPQAFHQSQQMQPMAQPITQQQNPYPQYNQTPAQQPYQGGYAQAPQKTSNGLAVASLICGIAGLCLVFGVASIVAIVMGVMGRKNPVNRGMATAGLVLGIVGLVISVLFTAIFFFSLGNF